MFQALIATTKTIQHYIESSIQADPVLFALTSPYRARSMSVRLNTPDEMTDGNHEGISLWLYRVVRDEQRLNDPPLRPTPLTRRPAPLPLRLHYLVTPITSRANDGDPDTEQYLLGKVLQIFHSHPTLRGAELREQLTGTDAELRLRLESMSLDEVLRVWDAFDGSYQLSVSYEVGLVDIDSALEPETVTPVTTVLPEYGLIVS